jgi:hypothetical protein
VLVSDEVSDDSEHREQTTFACLYESASDSWGNIVSTATEHGTLASWPGILVGSALHWLFNEGDTFVFDIERQTVGVIEKPAQSHDIIRSWRFQLLRTDDGSGLVFALLSESLRIYFWERKLNSHGVVGWVLQQKFIQLEEMLPRQLPSNDNWIYMAGCDEDANVIVMSTWIGNFMLQLASLKITKISETNDSSSMVFFPYANFYSAGNTLYLQSSNNKNLISFSLLTSFLVTFATCCLIRNGLDLLEINWLFVS